MALSTDLETTIANQHEEIEKLHRDLEAADGFVVDAVRTMQSWKIYAELLEVAAERGFYIPTDCRPAPVGDPKAWEPRYMADYGYTMEQIVEQYLKGLRKEKVS